jgi:hypothetical protein
LNSAKLAVNQSAQLDPDEARRYAVYVTGVKKAVEEVKGILQPVQKPPPPEDKTHKAIILYALHETLLYLVQVNGILKSKNYNLTQLSAFSKMLKQALALPQ